MSRRSKLEKIHMMTMVAAEQIKVLSGFITTSVDNRVENQVLAGVINEKARQIGNANEKMGRILKI